MASTEHGKDKFNAVHFCATTVHLQYSIPMLHNVCLFLPHLSASDFGHLHGACSVDVFSLYANIFGNSLLI